MAKQQVVLTRLEEEIDSVLVQMGSFTADSPEYAKMLTQLEKLYKCMPVKAPPPVRMDTIVTVLGNIVGIVMILGFEHTHVITSKALSFVLKSKV